MFIGEVTSLVSRQSGKDTNIHTKLHEIIKDSDINPSPYFNVQVHNQLEVPRI